jgi:uncharacterized membrane protein YqjE
MVRSGTPEPAGGEQTLGELVSSAVKDVTQLVRYEVDLAKTELKADAVRVGVAAGLIGVGAFFGFFILIFLAFAWVYGINAMGMPGGMWAAFLVGAATFLLIAALAILGGLWWLKRKRLSGLSKTREAVTDSLSVLRRKEADGADAATELPGITETRRHPEVTGPQPR